jgi:Zn-dependent peptidase ImmA (M78 family)
MPMRTDVARGAVVRAARLRARLGYAPDEPLSPFDVAERIGVSVRLVRAPSLEGLYQREPATVVLGAQRPFGRRNFTLAHELGHHDYGHGSRLHQVVESEDPKRRFRDEAEDLADRYAQALLMPKTVVAAAFARRQQDPTSASASQIYIVSKELGVGFGTLAAYMCWTLNMLPRTRWEELKRTRPAQVREAILGAACQGLVVVDDVWRSRSIEAEVGDVLVCSQHLAASAALFEPIATPTGQALRARHAGVINIVANGKRVQLRVARREFEGIARYRFLADAEESSCT